MAITLEQQNILAQDPDFRARVRQAMATQALVTMTEDPADLDGGNAELAQRLNLARRVLNDPQEIAKRAAFTLVTADALNTADPTAITDNQYIAFVAANWSALAGYNPLFEEGA